MTTIAWDGKTLAGDRRVTFGNSADCETRKIGRGPEGGLIGIAGLLVTGANLLRWFEAGERGDRPTLHEGDAALIIRPNGSLELHSQHGWAEIFARRYSIGSGCEYALAAMAMNADAVRAVHQAAMFDTKTGDVVDSLTLGAPA